MSLETQTTAKQKARPEESNTDKVRRARNAAWGWLSHPLVVILVGITIGYISNMLTAAERDYKEIENKLHCHDLKIQKLETLYPVIKENLKEIKADLKQIKTDIQRLH